VQDEALEKLSKIAPRGLDTVAFTNSGAEAVETALKMAWAYTGRRRIVAFRGGFHGRTVGALSVTWSPAYRRGFPLLGDVRFAEYNSPEAVEEAVDESVAAVIVEPVLGEGGVVPASREFMRAVEEAARRSGALLIVDEVQTGFGRCGRVWCHELYGVKPDILVAGKALGGGFPVAAVFAGWDVARSLPGGRHGSTFGGNPLALAAVSAAVDVLLGDSVPSRAEAAGRLLLSRLREQLEGVRAVRSVRGVGLMAGVELRFPPGRVLECLQSTGVLALKAGATVVRLLPPYMVTPGDVEVLAGAVRSCICRVYGC
jgi:acetylornithine/LysW-gamma-L-lysine aminotransferase